MDPYSKQETSVWTGRTGAVGVLIEHTRFLVIRRSPLVRAPNLVCFPGGSIESGEPAEAAVCRELQEELTMPVKVLKHLWRSQTAWGTRLEWFQVQRIDPDREPIPLESEVAEYMWLSEHEICRRTDLLGSMPTFFKALQSGEFRLEA